MVSAFAANNGTVLGQVKTAEKSNQITAILALLDLLDIKGSIVPIDVMERLNKCRNGRIRTSIDITVKFYKMGKPSFWYFTLELPHPVTESYLPRGLHASQSR